MIAVSKACKQFISDRSRRAGGVVKRNVRPEEFDVVAWLDGISGRSVMSKDVRSMVTRPMTGTLLAGHKAYAAVGYRIAQRHAAARCGPKIPIRIADRTNGNSRVALKRRGSAVTNGFALQSSSDLYNACLQRHNRPHGIGAWPKAVRRHTWQCRGG